MQYNFECVKDILTIIESNTTPPDLDLTLNANASKRFSILNKYSEQEIEYHCHKILEEHLAKGKHDILGDYIFEDLTQKGREYLANQNHPLMKDTTGEDRIEVISDTTHKKIFISHSAEDSHIGERFLEFLESLGFEKKDIFYSSKYHNGVELGKSFPDVVKESFKSASIIVFLLTTHFYASPFCLNEMGAAWISDEKEIVPILLGELSFSDMKGFLGSQTKTFSPKNSERDELYSFFVKRTKVTFDKAEAARKYNGFLSESINTPTSLETLSEEAEEILKELSIASNGYIIYSNVFNVVQIKCDNNKELCNGKTILERIKYKEAMESLISNEYVEQRKKRRVLSLIYPKTKGLQYVNAHLK